MEAKSEFVVVIGAWLSDALALTGWPGHAGDASSPVPGDFSGLSVSVLLLEPDFVVHHDNIARRA